LIKGLPKDNQTMAQFALSYCLAYEEIATVIPGCVNEKQHRNNLSSLNNPMGADMVKELEELYDNTIRKMKLPWETDRYLLSAT